MTPASTEFQKTASGFVEVTTGSECFFRSNETAEKAAADRDSNSFTELEIKFVVEVL